MPISFYPDIGWFYLSARDAILSAKLPLLGITSSVTWLHQGPIWTYLLIPPMLIFRFHPLSGVFVSSFFYLLSTVLSYWLSRLVFNRRTAFFTAVLFFISPLLFAYSLMPFVTSIIPALTLLFLLLLFRRKYFMAFLILGLLYQAERISLLLWPAVLIELYRHRHRFHPGDLLAFLLGSLPLVLAGPIEFLGPFLFAAVKLFSVSTSSFNWNFYSDLLSKLIFPLISQVLLLSSVIYMLIKKHRFSVWLILPLLSLYLSKTASEAYFIQIIPFILLPVSHLLSRYPKYLLAIILFAGIYQLTTSGFFNGFSGYGLTLSQKTSMVKNLGFYPEKFSVLGPGQEFATVSDPYTYLFWYYYRIPRLDTAVVINEYLQMIQ